MKYKKIAAIGAGLVLLGATLSGCSWVSDKELSAKIEQARLEGAKSVDVTVDNSAVVEKVVGELKDSYDVRLGALEEQAARDAKVIEDYKAELAKTQLELESQKEVIVEEETAVATPVENYEVDELSLNAQLTSFVVDDSDLKRLLDSKIEFADEENIDVHEEIRFAAASTGIRTSVYDADFNSDVYMTLEAANSIEYRYVFDDALDYTTVTYDDPLEINFLGQDLEIVDVTSSQFTVIKGETIVLDEGESKTITVDGQQVDVEVTVITDESAPKIGVKINGVSKTGLSENDIAKVGNYEVYVKSIMANEAGDVTADFVELRVAKDVQLEFDAEDLVTKNDDRFEYTIGTTGTNLNYLGVSYVEISDDLDDDYQAIKVGDALVFPNEYFKVSVALDEVEYVDYDLSFSDVNGTDALKIKSSDSEGIVISGIEKVDEIEFNGINVFYDDDDGDEQVTTLGNVKLVNEDTELALAYAGNVLTIGTNINVTTNGGFDFLGTLEDEAEASDVSYNGINYGTRDETVITSEGIIINTPENNADSDRVEIRVPSDVVKATLTVE